MAGVDIIAKSKYLPLKTSPSLTKSREIKLAILPPAGSSAKATSKSIR